MIWVQFGLMNCFVSAARRVFVKSNYFYLSCIPLIYRRNQQTTRNLKEVIKDKTMNNFELQYEVTCNGKFPVSKYVSKKTGLTVCIAQVDGPIVNGYFCLGMLFSIIYL